MIRTLPELRAQLRQSDRFIQMLFNIAAYGFDQLLAGISSERPGTAAQAFAKAGTFSFTGMTEEAYILAPRPL